MLGLANLFSLLNLFSGLMAISRLMSGDIYNSVRFFVISLISDGLDGTIARREEKTSEIGKNLDSLSDLVSFGVYPLFFSLEKIPKEFNLFSYVFVLCGALRLARFNVLPPSDKFVGLPIPAAGSMLVFSSLEVSGYLLLAFLIVLSILMVSEVEYHSLKGRDRELILLGILLLLVLVYPTKFSRLLLILLLIYLMSPVILRFLPSLVRNILPR